MKAVIYTGGTALGNEVAEELKTLSWDVVVYEKKEDIPESVSDEPIELLLLTGGNGEAIAKTDGVIGTEHDYDAISAYLADQMTLRYDLINKYMPALNKGTGKRIGFISYRYASVSDNKDTQDFAIHMDAAGMSMQAKMVHEKYRLQDMENNFTVRYFAAEVCPEERKKGISAAQYMLMNFSRDLRYDPRHYEENHLRMRDHKFIQIPW